VKTLTTGDFFGANCLMSNDATRNATVTVSSSSISLYELGREAFNKLLGPVMKKKIAKTADERKEITELKTVSGLGDFFFLILFFPSFYQSNVVFQCCLVQMFNVRMD
jgi:CRP-like cAMP-binding protein